MSLPPERRALVIAALGLPLGPVVLELGFAPFDQRVAWLTVLSGWIWAACGLIAWLRNPIRVAGPLLVLGAVASFAGAALSGVDGMSPAAVTIAITLPWLLLGHAAITVLTRQRNRFGRRGMVAAYFLLVSATVAGEGAITMVLTALPDPRVVACVVQSAAAIGIMSRVVGEVGRRQRTIDFILDLDASGDGPELDRRLRTLAEQAQVAVDDPSAQRSLRRVLASITVRQDLEIAAERELEALSSSRRRIIEAADAENRQLRVDLEDHVGWRLRELAERLQRIAAAGETAAARAGEHIAHAQRDVDAILEGLPPVDLERMGLPGAISELVARSPLPVRFSARGGAPVDEGARTALYYTCSEALANVIRHARATSIRIVLAGSERAARLRVIDDGVGGTTIGGGDGTGLTGLRDRLEAVGGRLEVASSPGGGTVVMGTVPILDTVEARTG